MELRVLGPLEVVEDGHSRPVGRGRQRAVLGLLLLHANEVVSSDRLIDEIWGESPPRTAQAALQNHVSALRKILGAEPLETRAPGYLLHVRPGELDMERFERLIREARERREAGDHASASSKLRAALALWRGPALADFTYEPFAQAEIARLEELRIVAFEERIDADLAQGHDAELVGELEPAIREHPLRERLRGQLMLALYRCGRQADALDAYREAQRKLDQQLGIAPSPGLKRLETAILRQEPALELSVELLTRPGSAESRLARPEEAPEARKTVTVMIAARRTPIGADPEIASREGARFRATLDRIVSHYGGTVTAGVGDQLMAVLGVPSVHEDDALRAASAALELRDDLDTEVRVGVATGEALAAMSGSGPPSVAGPPVALAGELVSAASPGEILISDETARLVRDAARSEAVGLETGRAWRLTTLADRQPPLTGVAGTPLVGREPELEQLMKVFDQVVREGTAHLVTILGPAGIGKSRLAQEFAAQTASDAAVLAGRCVPYGEGITFWPLSEIVGQITAGGPGAGGAGRLVRQLADAIGEAGTPGTQEEIFWTARELFEALAREKPLILVFEDVHWAEPTLLDLVEYLADRGGGAPMLIVSVGRPELLEQRPAWREGRAESISLQLDPLPDAESETMVGNLDANLPEETRARVLDAAGGNPLFIEQLVAKLEEESEDPGELPIPPTIQALLAARLDRLGPGERAVIGCGAVAGREFSAGAVADMVPEDARDFVPRHLEALTRRELIGAPTASPLGGEGFRFRHILIQQAAYRALPKGVRGDLHERFGDWVAAHSGEGAGERSEIVGYHLEQAFRYRTELGPATDAERELARRAGGHLASAGRRAFGRGDMPATVNLLSRSASLLAKEEGGLSVLPELGYALFEVGEEDRADTLLGDARIWARAAGDRAAEWRAAITRRRVEMYMTAARSEPGAIKAEAETAIEVFDELDDHAGLARTWLILSDLDWMEGRVTEAIEGARRAAAHARRAGNRREVGWALGQQALCALHGPMHVVEAQSWLEQLLEEAAENRGLDANLAGFITVLEAMGGDFEVARKNIESSRGLARDLGLKWQATVQELLSGYIELLAGDPVSAERDMRVAQEGFMEIGEGWWLSTVACDLVRAVYEQGRFDEAFELAQAIDEVPAPRDREWQIKSHGVRARVLARRGELGRAEEEALEAVARGASCEFLALHADAVADLAEVLRVADRQEEAAAASAEAARLYERKGNVAAVERLREPAVRS